MHSRHRKFKLNDKAYNVFLYVCWALIAYLTLSIYLSESSGADHEPRLRERAVNTKAEPESTNSTTPIEPHPLNVRITNPFQSETKATYDTHVAKGCRLWSLLQRTSSEDFPRSPFSEVADLPKWGWQDTQAHEDPDAQLEKILKGIKEPLEEKGVGITTAQGAKNIELTHIKHVTLNGKEYEATQAKFWNIFWPREGTIVSYRNYSPDYYKSLGYGGDTPVPELSHWSDVVFLTWVKETNEGQRRALRRIVRLNVMNDVTRDIVPEALKKMGVKSGVAPVWPGFTFKPEGNGLKPFQAVLATPNVRGIPWLLLQHEYQLDKKTIKAITVWDKSGMANQDAGVQLSMMVEIGDFEG